MRQNQVLISKIKHNVAAEYTDISCSVVEWIKTVGRDDGMMSNRAYRSTVCQVYQADLVESLLERFGIDTTVVGEHGGTASTHSP